MENESDIETNVVHTGDCFDVLSDLPPESVHAVVTDPPYGLAFMGRDWDDFEPKEYQEWCQEWATEVKRVLKPGGHLLAFSGNRTHHRLFTGVEDAGFEIRDTVTWHYGSGFPKASDISKTIDKRDYRLKNDIEAFGDYLQECREEKGLSKAEIDRKLGTNTAYSWWEGRSDGIQLPDWDHYVELKDILDLDDRFDELMAKEGADREKVGEKETAESWKYDGNRVYETQGEEKDITLDITEPATDAAKQWDGFKTGLKPATEYVVMARKPFDGATVDCVLEHGTGALNIDGTRIEGSPPEFNDNNGDSVRDYSDGLHGSERTGGTVEGRYPSNVVFDETEAERLDNEVGELDTGGPGQGGTYGYEVNKTPEIYGEGGNSKTNYTLSAPSDSGGPSRYFYTSKASKAERTEDGSIANAHSTVKPTDLMEWLVKLVTAENQIVLDPFAGSGTTCKAAKAVGRDFVGIEKQAQWADVARVRAGLTPNDPSHVRDTDDAQSGLEAYE